MKGLREKIALVTGGASGLGKATAIRLAAEGARVVITDLQSDLGRATASEHGLVFLTQDVCDEAQWFHIVGEIERRYGRLDILVNNAGIGQAGTAFEDASMTEWRKIFAVNVEGTFLGCRPAISAMRRSGGGSIVNISSIAAFLATPYSAAYGASKAAVQHLTKSIAQYCAQEKLNIRCNSVHPGVVHTPQWDNPAKEYARTAGIAFDEIVAKQKATIPLGDFTLPDISSTGVQAIERAKITDETRSSGHQEGLAGGLWQQVQEEGETTV